VTVTKVNRLPTANAGVDQTVAEGAFVTLDGTGSSDPDGESLNYNWEQTGGPSVSLANATTAQPSFTAPSVGASDVTLTFALTVDDGIASATDTVQVTVEDLDQITTLSPARLWIGLKNSDAVGLRLDLKAEVLLNGTPIGDGHLNNVSSGSSGFNNAKLNTIPLTLFAPVEVFAGDTLSITPSVRLACAGGAHASGAPRLWFNDSQADTHFGATIADTTDNFFLRQGFVLNTSAGTARKFIDVPVDNRAACPNRPYKPFGTWSLTLP
jgi:hypothetical protein